MAFLTNYLPTVARVPEYKPTALKPITAPPITATNILITPGTINEIPMPKIMLANGTNLFGTPNFFMTSTTPIKIGIIAS